MDGLLLSKCRRVIKSLRGGDGADDRLDRIIGNSRPATPNDRLALIDDGRPHGVAGLPGAPVARCRSVAAIDGLPRLPARRYQQRRRRPWSVNLPRRDDTKCPSTAETSTTSRHRRLFDADFFDQTIQNAVAEPEAEWSERNGTIRKLLERFGRRVLGRMLSSASIDDCSSTSSVSVAPTWSCQSLAGVDLSSGYVTSTCSNASSSSGRRTSDSSSQVSESCPSVIRSASASVGNLTSCPTDATVDSISRRRAVVSEVDVPVRSGDSTRLETLTCIGAPTPPRRAVSMKTTIQTTSSQNTQRQRRVESINDQKSASSVHRSPSSCTAAATSSSSLSSPSFVDDVELCRRHRVVLDRGPDGARKLGFSVVGGTDTPRGEVPIVVKSIFAGGLAAEHCNIKTGDVIESVNGVYLSGLTHQQAVDVFRRCKRGLVNIVLVRQPYCTRNDMVGDARTSEFSQSQSTSRRTSVTSSSTSSSSQTSGNVVIAGCRSTEQHSPNRGQPLMRNLSAFRATKSAATVETRGSSDDQLHPVDTHDTARHASASRRPASQRHQLVEMTSSGDFDCEERRQSSITNRHHSSPPLPLHHHQLQRQPSLPVAAKRRRRRLAQEVATNDQSRDIVDRQNSSPLSEVIIQTDKSASLQATGNDNLQRQNYCSTSATFAIVMLRPCFDELVYACVSFFTSPASIQLLRARLEMCRTVILLSFLRSDSFAVQSVADAQPTPAQSDSSDIASENDSTIKLSEVALSDDLNVVNEDLTVTSYYCLPASKYSAFSDTGAYDASVHDVIGRRDLIGRWKREQPIQPHSSLKTSRRRKSILV